MNVYGELLELLCPKGQAQSPVCFGTIVSAQPPAVAVAGQTLSAGLVWPRGLTVTEDDVGAEVAMLPLPRGFLILFAVEGGQEP